MVIRFMSLSSGSCGNCYFLGNDEEGILIDAGVSLRKLKNTLESSSLSLNSFSAVLVTHDHLDHIRNLGSYAKRLGKPVFATPTLHDALSRHTFTKDYVPGCRCYVRFGEWNRITESIRAKCFEVPHDATQTVGYSIKIGEDFNLVIMTDIGRMTDEAIAVAKEADAVVVESNYDIDMLMGGPYPYELKMRICQGNGHLSNDECADAIRKFWHPGLKNIFLCHLSENNNTPKLAHECSLKALKDLGAGADVTSLRCLPRTSASPLLTVG